MRHRGQSLEQHLLNTFDILSAWRQPLRVRYAGLVHSVYTTDVFTHPTFAVTERDQVCELVGEEAERLAFLFCFIDRRELLSAVRASHDKPTDSFELRNRVGGPRVRLTSADAGDLLTMYMANAAEQGCRPDRSPAGWLSQVSLLGQYARRLAEVTAPVFDDCTVIVSKDQEKQLLSRYKRLVTGLAATDASAEWPFVAEPLIWAGLHAIAHDRPEEARRLGAAAATRLRQWGTPWDKRLPLRHWLRLCTALCDSSKADELGFAAKRTLWRHRRFRRWRNASHIEVARTELLPADHPNMATGMSLPTRSATAGSPQPVLPARFQTYLAGLRSNHTQPRMTMYPGLPLRAWHDPQQFQLVRDLESVADKIAAEVRALSDSGFQDQAENIARSGRWSVLFLYERGLKNEDNCSRCPETVAVIEANRTVLSLGGLAYFSRLEPGARVAPHTGPTNMRLRCHLGIDVPQGCGLRVGDVTRTWQEGRCLVFDDSFTHEVWNSGDRDRLILVVDLWHPDLTDDEVALLNGLHRYAAATGSQLARYWDDNRASALR